MTVRQQYFALLNHCIRPRLAIINVRDLAALNTLRYSNEKQTTKIEIDQIRIHLSDALSNASSPHFVYSKQSDHLSIPSWRTDAAKLKALNLIKLKRLIRRHCNFRQPVTRGAKFDNFHKSLTVLIVYQNGEIDRISVSSSDLDF